MRRYAGVVYAWPADAYCRNGEMAEIKTATPAVTHTYQSLPTETPISNHTPPDTPLSCRELTRLSNEHRIPEQQRCSHHLVRNRR